MAMTRAEKAAYEAIQLERDLYRAMVISPAVEPTVEPHKGYGKNDYNCGWLPMGPFDCVRVEKAAVNILNHRIGHDAWRTDCQRPWSQRAPKLYATKLDAWRQARHQVSIKCAELLARIDREIECCEEEDPKP